MQINFNPELISKISFLTGSADILKKVTETPAKEPFSDIMIEFLNEVSRQIMRDPRSRTYSDVITFGFWIRKSSVVKMKERFACKDDSYHLGKGVVFHIAPSNVPVNFAYSLVVGLLTGNVNVVRVPSKDFPQVTIITEAFIKAMEQIAWAKSYVICVRYDRNKDINDMLSAVADMRVVWGGDQTVTELRRSPLPPRAGEITFADRYSFAVIDADAYLEIEDKKKVAEDFYNDTFFTDQNACTSPRIVVWMGENIEGAKASFWEEEYALVKTKYEFQPIQAVNKLTKSMLIAVAQPGVKLIARKDNRIVRVKVPVITEQLMEYRDNSGYFYEYDCKDVMELVPLCNDKRCQTIAYIGKSEVLKPLIEAGVKGIDRIVPVGKTMDFDLIWDGYDLTHQLSRSIVRA